MGSIQPLGNALPLVELAQRAGQVEALLSHCREKGDLLGFAAGLAQAKNG
jgi:hypothetical protein